MPPRGFEDDRLELVLSDVAHRARAGAFIVGLAIDARAPCRRPRQFQAGKRGRKNLRTHDVLWHRRLTQKFLDAQVAQDFDRSLIGDVGTRRISRAAVLGDADRVHSGPGQECGCGKSRRACADDEDIGSINSIDRHSSFNCRIITCPGGSFLIPIRTFGIAMSTCASTDSLLSRSSPRSCWHQTIGCCSARDLTPDRRRRRALNQIDAGAWI